MIIWKVPMLENNNRPYTSFRLQVVILLVGMMSGKGNHLLFSLMFFAFNSS
jgi:hypothetical protein